MNLDVPVLPGRGRRAAMLSVVALVSVAAFGWPLFFDPGSITNATQAPLVFALVLPLILAVVVAELTNEGMDARTLAMLGVLAAVAAALRPLGAGVAGLEAIFFLIIVGGRAFGAGFGFALGSLSLFASALLTSGVGPWLPYQMLASGLVGMGAGLLPRAKGWSEIVLLSAYTAFAAFAYGWIMDFAFWPFTLGLASELSFVPGAPITANLHRFVLFNVATSMGWNLGRALVNMLLVVTLGPAVLRIIRRAGRRASIASPVPASM